MHFLIKIGAALAFATTAQADTPGSSRPATVDPRSHLGSADAATTRSIYEDFATLAGASYRIRGLATSRREGIAFDDRASLPALVALSGIGFDAAAHASDPLSTAAVIVPDETHREDPAGKASGDPRAAAMPDPGTVQVFGLGLVILAMVAGSIRREPANGR